MHFACWISGTTIQTHSYEKGHDQTNTPVLTQHLYIYTRVHIRIFLLKTDIHNLHNCCMLVYVNSGFINTPHYCSTQTLPVFLYSMWTKSISMQRNTFYAYVDVWGGVHSFHLMFKGVHDPKKLSHWSHVKTSTSSGFLEKKLKGRRKYAKY
jgi:hypothetical protein